MGIVNTLWSIIKSVGTGVISSLVGGNSIIAGVNELLPDGSKLNEHATGIDIENAISKLDPDSQIKILSLQFNVDAEKIKQPHETMRAMLETEAISPQSTRPKIALEASRCCYVIAILSLMPMLWAGYKQNSDLMKAIAECWPLVVGILTLFVGWVNGYFGILRDEQANKLNAANHFPITATGGMLTKLFKRK